MADIYCQNCGTPVSAYDGCPNCGNQVPFAPIGDGPSKKCPNCRMPNRESAVFCYQCGHSFSGKAPLVKSDHKTDSIDDLIKEKVEIYLRKVEKPKMGSNKLVVRSNQKRVGLWGPKGAGKTVYMVSLYLASKTSLYKDWRISLDGVDDDARAFFDGMAGNLLKGIFPPPNPPEKGEPDIYNFVFYPNHKKDTEHPNPKFTRETEDKLSVFWKKVGDFLTKDEEESATTTDLPGIAISFADVAGERYLKEKSDSVLWEHLAGCQGLICLIDPTDCVDQFQATSRLGGLLKQKITNDQPDALIDGKRYLPHYLSLCFSKMDRPVWKDFVNSKEERNPDELVTFLEKETGFNIMSILETDFSPDRIKLHFISSVGLDYEFDDKSKKPKPVHPYNIFAPLNAWIE